MAPDPPLERLDLPPGFAIEVFAEVPGARSLAVADGGRKIYVGTREQDLYAVLDGNRDGVADGVLHVATGLKVPNGLAASDGRLFVAEQHRIIRFEPDGKVEIVVPAGVLPDFRHHGWRYAAFGPDGKLYVAIGAPCNVCEVAGFEGTIIRMNRDGHNLEIFARGVRNSVGFDWHPVTGEMFFTDNGGDDLGDLIPPDELNRAQEPGLHFGYPFVYGDGVPYPQLAGPRAAGGDDRAGARVRRACGRARHPLLSRRDVPGRLPQRCLRRPARLVEPHRPDRLSDHAGPLRRRRACRSARRCSSTAGSGRDGRAWGRVVDVAELPDGSLLVSDDLAGLVYRITYSGG